ncbi:BON domain-containing protein [Bradyrhizobium sp. I71]|nr:BON domain-containing protein [Bradyrhizobium sp. I71]
MIARSLDPAGFSVFHSGPAWSRPHRHHRAGREGRGCVLHRRPRLLACDVVRTVHGRQGHLHAGRRQREPARRHRRDQHGPLRLRLSGAIFDERAWEAARVVAENVAGVKGVIDQIAWIEPMSGMCILPEPTQQA